MCPNDGISLRESQLLPSLTDCTAHSPRQSLSAPVHCRGRWTRAWGDAALLCWSSGCTGGGSCIELHGHEGRGISGWELAQRKVSALKGVVWIFQVNSSSGKKLLFLLSSHSLIITLLPADFPSWRCYPVPCLVHVCAYRQQVRMHAFLCSSEPILFAEHSLGACSCLQL